MKEYKIEIVETLRKVVTVTASNEDMARRIVIDRWHDEEYILNYDDFEDVDINNVDE